MNFFSKDFVMGYFSRNKKYFIISLAIFGAGFFLGAFVNFLIVGTSYGEISTLFRASDNVTLNDLLIDSGELFFNNLRVDLLTILSGFLFSVFSVLIFFFNAILIALPFGEDFTFAFIGILPHGIFEYSASVVSLAAEFLITRIELDVIGAFKDNAKSVRDVISESKIKIYDIL